jgi:hypothetical protein
MENRNKIILTLARSICFLLVLNLTDASTLMAQDSTKTEAAPPAKKKSFAKNTFEGNYLIDNQSVIVPIKGTLEFDIQHRFGTVNNGLSDFFGIFAGATMRLGISYVPIKNLQIGFGGCNDKMQIDGNVKYALLKQTRDWSIPISITYFGNIVMDTRKADATTLFVTTADRLSFFNQIIFASKITDKFSVQVSPSLSHFNNVPAYTDVNGKIQPAMKNDHFAVSVSGRYKITQKTAIIINYDQPLTQHPTNNPYPNLSMGIQMHTSGHDFQVFAGNYSNILPQDNNVLNQNDYRKGQFVIGFNITRIWNY